MAIGKKTGGGSRKGRPNKATADFRETVQNLLDDNRDNVSKWLSSVAKEDPARALDLLSKLAEYAAPKLSRTEIIPKPPPPVIDVTALSYEQRMQLRGLLMIAQGKQEAIGRDLDGDVEEETANPR